MKSTLGRKINEQKNNKHLGKSKYNKTIKDNVDYLETQRQRDKRMDRMGLALRFIVDK